MRVLETRDVLCDLSLARMVLKLNALFQVTIDFFLMQGGSGRTSTDSAAFRGIGCAARR